VINIIKSANADLGYLMFSKTKKSTPGNKKMKIKNVGKFLQG